MKKMGIKLGLREWVVPDKQRGALEKEKGMRKSV